MKRFFLLIMGLFVILTFSACQGSMSSQREISDALGIDISSGTIGTNFDTHNGFHGDGEQFVSMTFSDDSMAKKLSQNAAWKTLPLSENLTTLVYGTTTESGHSGPYLTDENGKAVFPDIQNGYYYFIDRQNQGADRYDDTNVLERYSLNFTVAIYDTDTDTLYYAELDT